MFARVLTQAGRGLDGRSQGVYLFAPDGESTLLAFNNTHTAEGVKELLATALSQYQPEAGAPVRDPKNPDNTDSASPLPSPPDGGLVLDVTAKVLGGYDDDAESEMSRIHAASLAHDHLWVRKDEAESLASGVLPDSLATRIARHHLLDNTRGEPPSWAADEVRSLSLTLDPSGRLTGSAHLQTAEGDRGYRAALLGFVESNEGGVTRLDLVATGQYWGETTFTRGAPAGEFPFAVTFRLTELECEADRVPPGATRGNEEAYLQ